jgi:hypothetical protein
MKRYFGCLILSLVAALVLAPSARGTVYNWTVSLNGAIEIPANGSAGTGSGTVAYDSEAHSLALHVDFSGLNGNTTASHIHASGAIAPFDLVNAAGVATTVPSFVGFPLGVQAGSFTDTLDLTLDGSWNPAFRTANGGTNAGAEAALFSLILQRKAYWNIHSSTNTGGEIRGFLVPEPGSLMLLTLGALSSGLVALCRRR